MKEIVCTTDIKQIEIKVSRDPFLPDYGIQILLGNTAYCLEVQACKTGTQGRLHPAYAFCFNNGPDPVPGYYSPQAAMALASLLTLAAQMTEQLDLLITSVDDFKRDIQATVDGPFFADEGKE